MQPAERTALLIGACEWGDLEALERLLELGEKRRRPAVACAVVQAMPCAAIAVGLLIAVGLAVSVGQCSMHSLCWGATGGGLHASFLDPELSLVCSNRY